MNGFNKVILAGNLTRDPELRYTPSGTAICKGGLALNRKWRDSEGETKEEVVFVDLTAFGDTGALMAEHLEKGQAILFEGRLQQEQWQDKQTGQPRSKLSVVVERFTFLPQGENSDTPQAKEPKPQAKPAVKPAATQRAPQKQRQRQTEPEEDDVPF